MPLCPACLGIANADPQTSIETAFLAGFLTSYVITRVRGKGAGHVLCGDHLDLVREIIRGLPASFVASLPPEVRAEITTFGGLYAVEPRAT